LEGKDFALLALGKDLERAAANLAIGGEPLSGNRGVEDQVEALAAPGALDGV